MLPFDSLFIDETRRGTKIKTDDYLASGTYSIVDQGQSLIAGYTNLKEGVFYDVPAIIFGDHTRAIKYIDEPFFLGADGTKILKSKDGQTNGKYLYYALRAAKIPNLGYSRHFKCLKELKFKTHSRNEQDKIVTILDNISKQIDSNNQKIKQLDELVKARFVEMFDMGSYPIKPLSEIAEYWNGLTYKPSDVSSDGIIVLRSSNIQDMQLDLDDIVRVKCEINDKKMVKPNDILMCSRNGSAKLVGKVALIPELEEAMSFGAFMMIIRSEYYPYLMTYFQLPAFRSQISTGTTTINQITRYMLDKVLLPVPDMEKVNEFKAFVAQVDKSKFALSNELAMCNFYVRLVHDRVMHGRIDLRVS